MHLKINIVKRIVLLLLISLPIGVFGQAKAEKIKGNKIVELKTQKIEEFTSIEVGNLFEVDLVLKATPSISVDADSNLHEYISITVQDGKLSIKATKTFIRYKRLFVEIGVNSKLTDIYVRGKAKLSTKNTLTPEKLNVETLENGKVNLDYKSTNASFFAKGKSKIKASGEADIISIENSIFQIIDDSFLNSAGFVSGTTVLTSGGDADSYINTADKLTLEATGKSNTYILGNPLINLKVFKEEATIYKTNKAPRTLKSLLK